MGIEIRFSGFPASIEPSLDLLIEKGRKGGEGRGETKKSIKYINHLKTSLG